MTKVLESVSQSLALAPFSDERWLMLNGNDSGVVFTIYLDKADAERLRDGLANWIDGRTGNQAPECSDCYGTVESHDTGCTAWQQISVNATV